MKNPSFLWHIFVYENDSYGWPQYRTNKLNWYGIKQLFKSGIKKLYKIAKWILDHIVPAIIIYLLIGE